MKVEIAWSLGLLPVWAALAFPGLGGFRRSLAVQA